MHPTSSSAEFDLKQLTGRWESIQDREHRFEEWTQVNDSTLLGTGYVLIAGDTTYIEFLCIRRDNGVLTYLARGGDRSNEEVIAFTLQEQSANRIEFANPEHAFPQRIVYQIDHSDELTAFIEGPQSEGQTRIYFDFVRTGSTRQN